MNNSPLLALKLIFVPALIGGVSLAGRKWGPAVSGWLAGFPFTSGPVALILALDWLLLLMIPSCVVLHFAVVRREEFYLERKFGEAYRRYKARVPRYLLGY